MVICLFLTSQASNQYLQKGQPECQIVKPFPIIFFTVFTDNVTLTHLLLLLESLLSVMSFVFSFFVVYTEEIGNLVHGFTLTHA